MKIIFLASFSDSKMAYKAKDEENFPPEVAIKLIDGGIAKAKVKKEYVELKAKIEAAKVAEEENKVKAYAILQQDKLKESAEQLAKELHSTLELIEDEEFKTTLLKDERDDLIEQMKQDIETLSTEELHKKYVFVEVEKDIEE